MTVRYLLSVLHFPRKLIATQSESGNFCTRKSLMAMQYANFSLASRRVAIKRCYAQDRNPHANRKSQTETSLGFVALLLLPATNCPFSAALSLNTELQFGQRTAADVVDNTRLASGSATLWTMPPTGWPEELIRAESRTLLRAPQC